MSESKKDKISKMYHAIKDNKGFFRDAGKVASIQEICNQYRP